MKKDLLSRKLEKGKGGERKKDMFLLAPPFPKGTSSREKRKEG